MPGERPFASSITRSEIALAPDRRPARSQILKRPSRRGRPSLRAQTRQPPASTLAITVPAGLCCEPRGGPSVEDRRSDGVGATNREFVRYDQVEKRQTYHLAETADGAEAFDEDYAIRTCDLGRFLRGGEADRRAFATELGEALEAIGFAVLEGHGVDRHLYDRAHDAVLDLFTQTPLEEKLRFRARRHGSVNQGYFPIKQTSGIHPDLVEGWVFCRRAFDLGDDPSAPPRLEEF
ncbi:MAG: hypothetical protein DMF83_04040, partial [Acidobacteria bacterium]